MSHHEDKNLDRQAAADKARNRLNEAAGKPQPGKATGNREQDIRSKAPTQTQTQARAEENERERKFDR